MNGATVTLQRASDDGSHPYVETLLARNDLPSEDVHSKPECFYVAYAGDERAGADRDEPGTIGSDGPGAVDSDGPGAVDSDQLRAVGSDEPVGIGGVEIYGTDGLLRSIVVDRAVRGAGYGTAICDALERRAKSEGVETLYLLTTTAADFFDGRGYVEIERETAPGTIRRTTEFSDLCPGTAICMTKEL